MNPQIFKCRSCAKEWTAEQMPSGVFGRLKFCPECGKLCDQITPPAQPPEEPAYVHTVTPAGLIPAPDVALPGIPPELSPAEVAKFLKDYDAGKYPLSEEDRAALARAAKTFALESPAEAEAHAAFPPLLGEWRANNGYLCNGTLRVARTDFDTDPSPKFRREVFEWIAKTLNEAAALRGERDGLRTKVAGGWKPMDKAPRDGEVIEGLYDCGPVLIRWAEARTCMLAGVGGGNGYFGPGWEDDYNHLIVDAPMAWREEGYVDEELSALRADLAAAKSANEQLAGVRKELTDACPSAKMHSTLRNVITHVCTELTAAITRAEKAEGERDALKAERPTWPKDLDDARLMISDLTEIGQELTRSRDHALRQVETLRGVLNKAEDVMTRSSHEMEWGTSDTKTLIEVRNVLRASPAVSTMNPTHLTRAIDILRQLFSAEALPSLTVSLLKQKADELIKEVDAMPAAPANEDTLMLDWLIKERFGAADGSGIVDLVVNPDIASHEIRSAIRAAMRKEGK